MLAPAPVRANVYAVTTTADGNNGACTVSLCTLRDAIIAANANPGADIITLPAGTYTLSIAGANEDAAATGDLDITESLTINGAGASTTGVDGGRLDRVFDIIGSTTAATFNGISILKGLTTGQGGGIRSAGALILNNCFVFWNETSDQGGGIFAVALTLNLSIVTENQSAGQGGGLFLINGASTITTSAITFNIAADDGGGIYLNGSNNSGSPAILNIVDSTIWANQITSGNGAGGGIFILSFASVAISGSILLENSTNGGSGGGILNGGALTTTNTTIYGNTITTGSGGGGGVRNIGGLNITSSTIASNSAPTTGGNLQNSSGTTTLKNTIVSSSASGTNCDGAFMDRGTNLQFPGTTCGVTIASSDPLLELLANNGGSTLTRALRVGSPAINAASGCPPPSTDQRGISRPQGSACEIGSFECQTGECGEIIATATPTQPAATTTPTPTPTTVAATPTRTPTPIAGVAVPTLIPPMLAFLGLALAGAALLLLKK